MKPLSCELVVARHREDLQWLRRIPSNCRATVYDKGGGHPGGIPLPNLGREAHSYLHHLVERYDELADVTVFSQGKPFDHAPDFHRLLRGVAAAGVGEENGFRWLGFMIDREDRDGSLFRNWGRNPDRRPLPLEAFWTRLRGEPPPDEQLFYPGAQFAVTRDRIRTQPRSFYEHARELAGGLPDAAHCFERCWDRIFGVDGIPHQHRNPPFPKYFRPVKRLGITWDTLEGPISLAREGVGS